MCTCDLSFEGSLGFQKAFMDKKKTDRSVITSQMVEILTEIEKIKSSASLKFVVKRTNCKNQKYG